MKNKTYIVQGRYGDQTIYLTDFVAHSYARFTTLPGSAWKFSSREFAQAVIESLPSTVAVAEDGLTWFQAKIARKEIQYLTIQEK